MRNTIYILAATLLLTGCAGLHSMPPNGYSDTSDPLTMRVFFDQEGDLYPSSPEAMMPKQKIFGRNQGFSIRSHMENTGQEYGEENIDSRYESIVNEISKKMGLDKNLKLVFLIHGYNNSYEEASSSFEYIKSTLGKRRNNKYLFVEVYWDGLFKGPFSSPLPLAYWFDSLTYSNIAGQVGLRRILNKLPENTNVTVFTHSRGAGVAFSALFNPIYDDHIKVPKYEEFNGTNLRKLNIVSIAPAIGNGHPVGELSSMLPDGAKVFIGFNSNDPALQKSQKKIKIGSSKFGDTSLGTDEMFYQASEKEANKNQLILQRVVYKGYSAHGIRGYIDEADSTNCLFWAAELINTKPASCQLIR